MVVWYLIALIGQKSLTTLGKSILSKNGLDPEDFSNKSERTTLLTRMEKASVPSKVGMGMTGKLFELTFHHFFWINILLRLIVGFSKAHVEQVILSV
jgi:hypothetical protein